MSDNKNIFYNSTLRGVQERENEKGTVYYGTVFRRPSEPAAQDIEKYMPDLDELIARVKADCVDESCELPEDIIIEVYEVFDIDTGDFLTMIRIPVQEKRIPSPPGGGYVH